MPRCAATMPPSGKRRREKRCGRSALIGERHCIVHADAAELARHELRKAEQQRQQQEHEGEKKRRIAATAAISSAPPRVSPPRPSVTPSRRVVSPPRHSPPRAGAASLSRLSSPPKNPELPSPVNRLILQHFDVNELEEIGAGGDRRRNLPRSPGLERDFRRLETESDAKTCATEFRRLYASYLDQELRRDDADRNGDSAGGGERKREGEAEESKGDEDYTDDDDEKESKEERKFRETATTIASSSSPSLSRTTPPRSPGSPTRTSLSSDAPVAELHRVVCLADTRDVRALIQRYVDDTSVSCRNSTLGAGCTIGVNEATNHNSLSFVAERNLTRDPSVGVASTRVNCRLYATLAARGAVGGWTLEFEAHLPDRNALMRRGQVGRGIEWRYQKESAQSLRAAPYRAFERFMATALGVAQPDAGADRPVLPLVRKADSNRWAYTATAYDIERAVRVFARLVQAVRYAFADTIVLAPSARDSHGPSLEYVQLLQTAFPGVPVRLLFGYYMTSGSRHVDVPTEWDPRTTTLPPGVGTMVAKPGR